VCVCACARVHARMCKIHAFVFFCHELYFSFFGFLILFLYGVLVPTELLLC